MIILPRSWKFIEAIEAADDVASIAKILVDIGAQFGFSSVFGGLVPDPRGPRSNDQIRPLIMVQHLPQEWAQRYNEGGYLFRDPILHRLHADLNPFTWKESYTSCKREEDVKLIRGEAAAFGLTDGYVTSVNTLDHRLAAVSFGGGTSDLSPDDAMSLSFAVSVATGHFLKLQTSQALPAPVTLRESECLLWAGEGKTDWEISVILGISRSTVTKHIASAREKLGAVNKTHAVAIAMRNKVLK